MKTTRKYVLHYKGQGCWDDGGIGHDAIWYPHTREIDAQSDKAALEGARKFVREKDKPCNSFACNNTGHKQFVKLVFLSVRETSKSHTVTERLVAVADLTKYCGIPGGAFGDR